MLRIMLYNCSGHTFVRILFAILRLLTLYSSKILLVGVFVSKKQAKSVSE